MNIAPVVGTNMHYVEEPRERRVIIAVADKRVHYELYTIDGRKFQYNLTVEQWSRLNAPHWIMIPPYPDHVRLPDGL